ncbi:MAG: hypothetical protein ACE5KA_07030 [Nitrososphaerales archaeon]
MSKEGFLRMKGLCSALMVLTLAAILLVPLTSGILSGESVTEINIYIMLLLIWMLLAATFGIIYLSPEGRKRLKPITLRTSRREE